MTLEQIILSKLRQECRGIEQAITRRELLSYCHQYYDFRLTDRELRKIVEELAKEGVCSSERGYYIAKDKIEVIKAEVYLKKKAFPIFLRAKKIHEYYFSDEQLELPFFQDFREIKL